MNDMTTIQVSKELKEQLDRLKVSSLDSYNDVIEQLIEDSQELTERVVQNLKEALDDVKYGRVIPHEEVRSRIG